MNVVIKVLIIIILTTVISCRTDIRFNKNGWTTIGDCSTYPNREKMLKDLTENNKLRGLTYRQLIEKIGEPETNVNAVSRTLYYSIIIDYGHDIDPVYSKTLVLKYSNDSIITDFKIEETKH